VLPAGFKEQSGWYINEQIEDGYVRKLTRGMVRVLPALPVAGHFQNSLLDQVKRYVPSELQGAMSTLVFRRYVGDGLVAHFVHGLGVERGRKGNSWFAAYLIDCGTTWQPLIVAATYDELPPGVGFEMNINFALPKALDLVEPLLAGVRCNGPRDQPIVDPAALAGHYYFGSGASMDYVQIYTGETSTRYISYAGEYDLRRDGTVSYEYSSAGSQGAGTTFAGDRGKGRWRIERDLLIISLEGRQPKSLRIAGVHTFPDAKVAVLIDSRKPTMPTTVNDGSEFFSTKKR
jgi:hypothetical protein